MNALKLLVLAISVFCMFIGLVSVLFSKREVGRYRGLFGMAAGLILLFVLAFLSITSSP